MTDPTLITGIVVAWIAAAAFALWIVWTYLSLVWALNRDAEAVPPEVLARCGYAHWYPLKPMWPLRAGAGFSESLATKWRHARFFWRVVFWGPPPGFTASDATQRYTRRLRWIYGAALCVPFVVFVALGLLGPLVMIAGFLGFVYLIVLRAWPWGGTSEGSTG